MSCPRSEWRGVQKLKCEARREQRAFLLDDEFFQCHLVSATLLTTTTLCIVSAPNSTKMPPQRQPPKKPGIIAGLGLLYAGNYCEKKICMCKLLDLHGYACGRYRCYLRGSGHSFDRKKCSAYDIRGRASRVTAILLSYISPALCRRIPDVESQTLEGSLEALRDQESDEFGLCRPFKLFKLGPEIRQRIYGFALDLPLFELNIRDSRSSRETGLALALTAKQVRKETRTLWAGRRDFNLRLNNQDVANAIASTVPFIAGETPSAPRLCATCGRSLSVLRAHSPTLKTGSRNQIDLP